MNSELSKQTLIILHGWGGDKKSWADFENTAKDFFDIHIIEMPCFGDEPCPTDVWGVEEYADFVAKKLANLQTCKLVLLGHSFGGQVATVVAAKYPELIDKLILSGAAIIRPKKQIKRSIFFLIAKCGKILKEIPVLRAFYPIAQKILYKIARSPNFIETDGIKSDIFKKVIRQDVQHYLKDIQAPTLVIWGKHDNYVPLRYGKKIASQIPQATFEIITDGTHGLHIKKIDELLEKLRAFTSSTKQQ